jgi:integrase
MLDAFKNYLAKTAQVKAKYVPYYLKWVAGYYAFFDLANSQPVSNDQRKQFLKHISRSYEDWQVKQADAALRLYNYFLSIDHRGPPASSSDRNEEWKLLEEKTREALRLRQRSYNTEKTYIMWLRNFRGFVSGKHPKDLAGKDLQDFLSHLAVEKRVASSTQNQALNAIVFFYRHILEKDIENELSAVRAKQRRRLPVVLTEREVRQVLEGLSGVHRLMAMLIYGCGLRLQECLNLRIKDIDFERNMVIVRSGKGDKDRRTVFPESLKDDLIKQIGEIRSLYDQDRAQDLNGVYLPGALERKYPNAGKEWGWF